MRVVWTRTALGGIAQIYDYLVDFNPYAAAHVVRILRQTGGALAHFPYRGRLVPGTTLREIITAYPYIIRYRISRDEVVILRVRHSSRRPTLP